jgi:hypothetical protein
MNDGAHWSRALQVDAAVTEPNACSFQRFNRAAQVGIRRLGDAVARPLPGADRVIGEPSAISQFLAREGCQRPPGGELGACEANDVHLEIVCGFVIPGNLIILKLKRI